MCECIAIFRCAAAHALRDAYAAATSFGTRLDVNERYTAHLRTAGLIASPTTAAPTWRCVEACAANAPCLEGAAPRECSDG